MYISKKLSEAGGKFTAFILAAALVFACAPVMAQASPPFVFPAIQTYVSTEQQLRDAVGEAQIAGSRAIGLLNDITLTAPLVINDSCSIYLMSPEEGPSRTIFAPDSRHLLLNDAISVKLYFEYTALDGAGAGGGIQAGALRDGIFSRVSGVNLYMFAARLSNCFSAGNGAALSVVGVNNTVTLTSCFFGGNRLAADASVSRSGGAVYMDGSPVFPWDEYTGHLSVTYCTFTENDAGFAGVGGAVGGVGIEIGISSSRFNDNHADSAGGAVYLSVPRPTSALKLGISCNFNINNSEFPATFTGNSASMGGAVAINSLSNLQMRGHVIFENDTADEAYAMDDPADIALHNAQIDSTVTASYGFPYVYNNCDVLYLKGAPVTTGGVTVTGKVKSYNPNNPTTIQLMQGGTEKYRATIAAVSGFGQLEQTFTFIGVAPGLYSLVITKPGHTSFTVQIVFVGSAKVDLTKDNRDAVKMMTLLCGDINGDQMINDNDLIVLWQAANYNKSAGQAADPLCDLNGDGVINDNDLIILWLAANYNKGPVVIT